MYEILRAEVELKVEKETEGQLLVFLLVRESLSIFITRGKFSCEREIGNVYEVRALAKARVFLMNRCLKS
jgi:hypothetical protein